MNLYTILIMHLYYGQEVGGSIRISIVMMPIQYRYRYQHGEINTTSFSFVKEATARSPDLLLLSKCGAGLLCSTSPSCVLMVHRHVAQAN